MTTAEWKAVRTRVNNGQVVVVDFDLAADLINPTVAAARVVFAAAGVNATFGISERDGAWKLRIAKA